jgi:hypothetical protein
VTEKFKVNLPPIFNEDFKKDLTIISNYRMILPEIIDDGKDILEVKISCRSLGKQTYWWNSTDARPEELDNG